MNAGLLFQWYRLEYMVETSISYDYTEHDADGGWLITRYTDPIYGPIDGITISASLTPDGDIRNYTCVIPALSINWSRTEIGGGAGTFNTQLVFENLRCYAIPTYGFTIYWDAIKWYTDGTLRQTASSGSMSNLVLKPSGIPLIGAIGPTVLAQCKADTAVIVTSAFFGGSEVDVTGGWRFKELSGDSWQTPAVSVDIDSGYFPSTATCDAGIPDLGTLPSATNTYNASVHAYLAVSAGTSGYAYADEYHYQITLPPNLERIISRMNPDYGALWYRSGFPQCSASGSWSCTPYNEYGEEETGTTGSTSTELLAHQSEMLSFVTNSAHTIEDPLSENILCTWHGAAFKQVAIDGVMHGIQARQATFPVIGTETNVPSWYQSTDDEIEYGDTWCNPLWSYLYFFPPDDDEDESWEVDGSDPTRLYWLAIRQQWIHNTALPSGEDTHQRNFIVESPLLDGGFSDWIKTYLFGNAETHWVGVPRFHVIEPDVPASFTPTSASSPCWTDTDCSLSFGSSITVTPDVGKTTAIIEHDIGLFGTEFEQSLHICDRIKPNWSTTNVSAVRVYAVSADGSTKVLLENTAGDGYTTRNVTYDIPTANDAKYAGSHAQDNGAGLVTDTGTDLKATGQSATVCADAERVHSFNLLGGGTFAKIRFEIDLSGNATLEYPVFYPSASDVTVLAENSHHHILLWPDGAGIRLGQWSWRNGTAIRTPPTVEVLGSPYVSGYRMTALDALCTKRVLFEGLASDDGLTTEIASLYDSVEGQTYTLVDQFTNAFWLPKASTLGAKAGLIALVNSFSAVPPLCAFPRKERDADWAEAGTYGQYTYSFCQLPRRLVNGGPNYLDMSVGGTVWTAPSAITVDGWKISEHSHAVDNTETGATIIGGTTEIAEVRPWWGWLFVFVEILAEGGDVANIHAALNMFMRAVANADGVAVKSAKHGSPEAGWWKSSTPITDAMSHVCLVPEGRDNSVLLLASDETTCIRKRTFDLGATWTTETAMTGTFYERGDESPMLFSTILGPVESTMTIKGQIKGPHESAYGAAFTVKTNTGANLVLEETPIDVHYSEDDEALILSCKASGETEFGEWVSWDHGKTFKKV